MSLSVRLSRTTHISKLLLAFVVLAGLSVTHAGEITKRPTKKLSYDPAAEKKELFAAIEEGSIDYKMVMKGAKEGNLILENKTDQPVSLELPQSLVGVQIFPQFGGGMDGGMGMGGAGGGAGGGQQAVGGGAGGGGMGGAGGGFGGGPGGAGGGFFSIPPETAVVLPLKTVCLEYGKREPSPRSTYKLVKTEEFTSDPALQELVALIGQGNVDPDVAQAAAWHLSSKLSWYDLATKTNNHFGAAGPKSLFAPGHILAAQNLVSLAVAKARETKPEEPAAPAVPSRVNPR